VQGCWGWQPESLPSSGPGKPQATSVGTLWLGTLGPELQRNAGGRHLRRDRKTLLRLRAAGEGGGVPSAEFRPVVLLVVRSGGGA
jgi:hypothetical protein